MDNSVKELQTALREIAFVYDEIPQVIPDGIYGEETTNSVKAFQTIFGLPITGETDFDTWTSVFIVKGFIDDENSEFVGPERRPLVIGDENEFVYVVQLFINEISKRYINFQTQTISGLYDIVTLQNVKEFQRIAGLPETGEMDITTFNRVVDLYNTIKPR